MKPTQPAVRGRGVGELLAPVKLHGRGAYAPRKERDLFPQGPCWTKPTSYPAWAGGSALRAGRGTMGKWMWTNQFPNYFPLLPPPTRRGKGRGQKGKGVLGPELQLPLRRKNGPWPSSLHLQPTSGDLLEAGWRRLRPSSPSGFPSEGEDYGGSRTEEPRPQDLF